MKARPLSLLLALLALLALLTGCAKTAEPGGEAAAGPEELLEYVSYLPWSFDEAATLRYLTALPAENCCCRDPALQQAAAEICGGGPVLTVAEISRAARDLAPLLSDLKGEQKADWAAQSAELWNKAVWIVYYEDRSLPMDPEADVEPRGLRLQLYLSAVDGHILDARDGDESYLASVGVLDREPTTVDIHYPVTPYMNQYAIGLREGLESLDAWMPAFSEGLEQDAVFSDTALQRCCMRYAKAHGLETPEQVSAYAVMLEAELKERGYLEENWQVYEQALYSDGCGELWFLPHHLREEFPESYYTVYFSCSDGHVIDIRFLPDTRGNYRGNYQRVPARQDP